MVGVDCVFFGFTFVGIDRCFMFVGVVCVVGVVVGCGAVVDVAARSLFVDGRFVVLGFVGVPPIVDDLSFARHCHCRVVVSGCCRWWWCGC